MWVGATSSLSTAVVHKGWHEIGVEALLAVAAAAGGEDVEAASAGVEADAGDEGEKGVAGVRAASGRGGTVGGDYSNTSTTFWC